jgi:cytosine/adenosine deaminase-related metal-dependent hydrolase
MLGDIATNVEPIGFIDIERTTFLEVIGFSRARASTLLSSVIERLDRMQRVESGRAVTLGQAWRFGISPHAPYTVSPDLLRQLIDLAKIRKLPVAMHLAESADELEFLAAGTGPFVELLEERSMWDAAAVPRGSRPIDYLRLLADAPRALVIHGNYLSAEEHQFLAGHAERMSLVYCPRTHTYFDHEPRPLVDLLSAGVRVALGTDSRASNPDLDFLAEMRHVARLHPSIDPHDVLRMGTLAGAEALGCASDVGSLTPGKLANLVVVPISADRRAAATSTLEALLAGNEAPSAVWVGGKRVQETNPP